MSMNIDATELSYVTGGETAAAPTAVGASHPTTQAEYDALTPMLVKGPVAASETYCPTGFWRGCEGNRR